MMNAHSIKRLLVRAVAVAAAALAAASLAACSTAQSPAPTTLAVALAPGASPATATSSAPAAAGSGPTVADGQSVVKTSCVGRCHPSALLNYRTSSASAQRIASSMGRRAGLSAGQQQAIALYFAQ